MIQALAVIAAIVSAVALLVGLFLTAFVLSLAVRASAAPDSRKRGHDIRGSAPVTPAETSPRQQ